MINYTYKICVQLYKNTHISKQTAVSVGQCFVVGQQLELVTITRTGYAVWMKQGNALGVEMQPL